MSLSLRDELRVVLSRNRVQLVCIGRELTLRGVAYRVLDKKTYSCETEAESSWAPAIQTLELALADLPRKPALAKVILSNQFMHYAMVELSRTLSNELEEIAYAKHCFHQLYGAGAESWDLRLNQDFSGAAQLASAVDGQLLQSLRELFARANVELKSAQPYLMAAYNNCHAQLQKQDAWFVTVEQGSLCLGLIQQGRWSSVRALKIGRDWKEKLPEILDREAYLTELDTTSNEIFLWAPEQEGADFPGSERWKIHKVKPLIRAGFAPEYDDRFALAMCG